MNIINQLLEKFNFRKRDTLPENPIAEIERSLNISLPEDYKYFLQNFHGFEGNIGNQYVVLWGLEILSERNINYLLDKYLPSFIGIGGNGGGECLAMDCSTVHNKKIVLTPFIGLDDHIEVGTSFTDFLLRLDNKIDWFN